MKSPQIAIDDPSAALRDLRDTIDAVAVGAIDDVHRLCAGSRRLIEESRELLARVDEILARTRW